MATAKSTRSRGRPRLKSRSRKPSRKPVRKRRPIVPPAIEEHISSEVGRLWRVSALMNILEIATNYTDDPQQTVGDTWCIAKIAGELIGQTIDGLDSVALEAAGKAGAR